MHLFSSCDMHTRASYAALGPTTKTDHRETCCIHYGFVSETEPMFRQAEHPEAQQSKASYTADTKLKWLLKAVRYYRLEPGLHSI